MDREKIEALLKAGQSGDPNVRKAAAIALGGADDSHAKAALAKMLKDKVWQVREAAIYSIGRLRVAEAAPYMLGILGVENEGSARAAILKWATARGDQQETGGAKGGAFAAAEKKPAETPWQLKKAAALTLSRLRPDIVVEPLIAALGTEESPASKMAALAGLGGVQAEQAAPHVIEALSDNHWNIRKVAATTLGRLRAREAVPRLVEALGDSKAAVRVEAVIALNHIKPEEALSALSRVLLADNNYEVRKTAATALGNLRDEAAAEALYKALEDENWMVRKAAIDALTNLKVTEAMEVMIGYLNDEQEDVRAAAAAGIIRLSAIMGR